MLQEPNTNDDFSVCLSLRYCGPTGQRGRDGIGGRETAAFSAGLDLSQDTEPPSAWAHLLALIENFATKHRLSPEQHEEIERAHRKRLASFGGNANRYVWLARQVPHLELDPVKPVDVPDDDLDQID